MKKKVIVVGAGVGGLSVAAFLAKDGHDVTVLEKNDQIGGRASLWKEKGFVFDMGPSWYLMPDAFETFFKQFGKKPTDYFSLKKLDPSYRIYFGKDDIVDIATNLKDNLALFDSLEVDGAKKIKEYLALCEYQYKVAMKYFLYKEYNSIFDMFNLKMLKEASKMKIFDNVDKYMDRFFTSERLKKILQYTFVFLGGSPYNTPALYALMSHVDFKLGVWYPAGGLNAVAQGITKLAREQGAHIKLNEEVTKIEVIDGKARKVHTKSGVFEADEVVVNADYAFAETHFLKEEYQTYPKSYWNKKVVAPSAFIIYLGINKRLPKLQHHNLFFHNDWKEHFDEIFKNPSWPDKPSYYVCAPSLTDPHVAPKGSENLFVLVPVAAGLKDSDSLREKYAEKIIADLENIVGVRIKDNIVVKRIFSQRDFISAYNSYQGTALGLAPTFFQTAFFRPKHTSKKVSNLYYTGQFTTPGAGMPIALISSQIVRDLLRKKHDK